MPYSRQRRSRRSRRLPYRRPLRRSRFIRRRPRRPARVTRRRILNVSSVKKQDSRLTFSNVDTPAVAPTQKTVNLVSNQIYMIPYIPTAQDKSPIGGNTSLDIPNYRSKDICYMRGYRERLTFLTDNRTQWILRRICFTYRGTNISTNATTTNPLWWEVAPNGFTRVASQALGTNLGTAIINDMFKGSFNVDWTNYFNAPLDNNRVTVKYDKIFRFGSQNEAPHRHEIKLWHGMNKNLHYRNDEAGGGESETTLSTSGNSGMGDYYIVDFIQAVTTSTSDIAQLSYEGTLFWHER